MGVQSVVFIDVTKQDKSWETTKADYFKLLQDFRHNINEGKYRKLFFFKILGDRYMLIFNDIIFTDLIQTVIEIRKAFHSIPTQLTAKLRIGISRGDLSQSQLFYNTQIDYVSPVINRASYLCSFIAKPYGIAIDYSAFQEEININDSDKYCIDNIEFSKGLFAYTIGGERDFYLVENIEEERLGIREIHITGFVFKNGKLLLLKRQEEEKVGASKYATPGGRLTQSIEFEKALEQKIASEARVKIKNIHLLDTYYIPQLKAPGICFYCEAESHSRDSNSYYSQDEISKLDLMASISHNTIKKAFEMNEMYSGINYRIRIILPHFCNFKCNHCHKEHVQDNKIFNLEKIKDIIGYLNRNCNLNHVTISGGEPFHKENFPHLLNTLKYLRELDPDIEISVVTNGFLLEKEYLKALKPYTVSLKISLYSTSFRERTGMEHINNFGEGYDSTKYINHIMQKIKLIEEYGIKKSLNILLNETEKDTYLNSFIEYLESEKIVLENIKIMQPIGDHFSKQNTVFYEDLPFYKKTVNYTVPVKEFSATKKILNLHGFSIIFFKYPCYDTKNCINCFEKWDLIISSQGLLQICERAVENLKYKHRIENIPSSLLKFDNYFKRYVEK